MNVDTYISLKRETSHNLTSKGITSKAQNQ